MTKEEAAFVLETNNICSIHGKNKRPKNGVYDFGEDIFYPGSKELVCEFCEMDTHLATVNKIREAKRVLGLKCSQQS